MLGGRWWLGLRSVTGSLQVRFKSVPCIGGTWESGFNHTKTEIGQGAVDHQQFIAKVVGEVGSAEIVKGIADEG